MVLFSLARLRNVSIAITIFVCVLAFASNGTTWGIYFSLKIRRRAHTRENIGYTNYIERCCSCEIQHVVALGLTGKPFFEAPIIEGEFQHFKLKYKLGWTINDFLWRQGIHQLSTDRWFSHISSPSLFPGAFLRLQFTTFHPEKKEESGWVCTLEITEVRTSPRQWNYKKLIQQNGGNFLSSLSKTKDKAFSYANYFLRLLTVAWQQMPQLDGFF